MSAVHELLQDITLLVNNTKTILHVKHVIFNYKYISPSPVASVLCFRKKYSGSVLFFIASQKSTIHLQCRVKMNKTHRKSYR